MAPSRLDKVPPMSPDSVSTSVPRRGLAVVTIDRPEVRNALDAATAAAVAASIQDAGRDSRVVILTGAGGAFCAGGDLDEIEGWSRREPDEVATTLYESFQEMVRAIRATPAIVIAAISGPAVGAGFDLALACDLRVAGVGAKLGQVWVKLGLIPGTGGAFLTQALIGPGRAADLILTGRIVTGREALELGLVNRLVEDGEVMEAAADFAGQVLMHPRDGVVANKRALVAVTDQALEAALENAARVQADRFVSQEFRRAVRDARS